jgi:hypothetical protein
MFIVSLSNLDLSKKLAVPYPFNMALSDSVGHQITQSNEMAVAPFCN